ncbi:SpoIIE family protein phosphatase [Kineococcus xinjiangensis]|uniref:SpoIIE family protein phosphatase n=1 Tax=Kineococcus xinjiangensis TaxID=512762 RepID=UPI001FE7CF81|nr:SpoIIE family protein phosphatase [Kineococcus xinjiangensis]
MVPGPTPAPEGAGADPAGALAGGQERQRAAQRLVATSQGSAVDRLTDLAARLLATPAAQLSLLSDVQTIGAITGVSDAQPGSTGSLADSLCTVTAASGAPLVVTDATSDERVSGLPPVTSGAVGAYLGVPLTGRGGHVVGALCVFGPEPRTWSPADVTLLSELASAAARELELSALSVDYASGELRWQLAIDAAGIGSWDWDLRTGRLTWDERLLELFGLGAADFDGTIESFNARVHPDDLARVGQALSEAIECCGTVDLEYRTVLPDGTMRWIQARGKALSGPAGDAVRVLGAAYDTTAGREADARLARVLESMSAAFYSLDREWCFTYVNAEAERLLGKVREELLGGNLWELFPAAAGSDFEVHYRAAVESGQPTTFEAYYPPPLDGWYELRAWPTPDGLSVYFLDITARRDAQEAAQRAQRAAERAAQRLRLVAAVSADLAAALDLDSALSRLSTYVVPTLADACIVSLVDEQGGLRDVASWHVDEELRPLLERYRHVRLRDLPPDAPVLQTVRTSRPYVFPDRATERITSILRDDAARQMIEQLAPESAVVMPLRARGRTVGLLTVLRGVKRPAPQREDLLTLEEICDRAGLALDNARLYTQQQRLAEGLQRSMLTSPPEPDHLQIVVRYRPAARAAQVGGDWYDAFLQPDGSTVLVIGDVMGHDVNAAAAMGQIRSLLRGIAYYSGAGPAAILTGLDATMQGLDVETTATAVVARLEQTPEQKEQGTTVLRWANAGHPPPLLLQPDGTVTTLDGRSTLLLGIDPSTAREDAERTVERGSTVLLYTDGLIERRHQSVDEGLELLRKAVADLAGTPLDELCDGILDRLLPEQPEDDVALVAVRLHLQDRPRPPEAGPRRVPRTPRPQR